MPIGVVGAGLAGLATAVRIKEVSPHVDVVLVEKARPESNTQIAGMRFRAGRSHVHPRHARHIVELLAARAPATPLSRMHTFASLCHDALAQWQQRPGLSSNDLPCWFGPQWGAANAAGKGHGLSVLQWLRQLAASTGVRFVQGNLRSIPRERRGSYVGALAKTGGQTALLEAEAWVLANGSCTGSIFYSTNKAIAASAHELAFHGGLGLQDSTTHMVHPFGRSGADGHPRVGCFETDLLHDVRVTTADPQSQPIGDWAQGLLASHNAHGHFEQLSRRLSRSGGPTGLTFMDGHQEFARVSQHYHHMGISTTDGVSVPGRPWLFAVGDASSIGFWTGHAERLPGLALSKCLVDAELVADLVSKAELSRHEASLASGPDFQPAIAPADKVDALRSINTAALFDFLYGTRSQAADRWLYQLAQAESALFSLPTFELSVAVAMAHRARAAGQAEPIRVVREPTLCGDVP